MKNIAAIVLRWLSGFFDETKPQSFSRGITLLIVLFILIWDSLTVHWTHKTIEGATLIAQFTGGATFYFLRRAAGVMENKATSDPADPANAPK